MSAMQFRTMDSPVGPLTLAGKDGRLMHLRMADQTYEPSHGGWERDRPVRLFRSRMRYDERPVHEHVMTDGQVGELTEPLIHYPYASLGEYFAKLDRYSRWWAEQNFARGKRTRAWTIALKPPARFFSMYVLRAGFLDGAAGVIVAALAAMSVAAKYARLWEMQRRVPDRE